MGTTDLVVVGVKDLDLPKIQIETEDGYCIEANLKSRK